MSRAAACAARPHVRPRAALLAISVPALLLAAWAPGGVAGAPTAYATQSGVCPASKPQVTSAARAPGLCTLKGSLCTPHDQARAGIGCAGTGPGAGVLGGLPRCAAHGQPGSGGTRPCGCGCMPPSYTGPSLESTVARPSRRATRNAPTADRLPSRPPTPQGAASCTTLQVRCARARSQPFATTSARPRSPPRRGPLVKQGSSAARRPLPYARSNPPLRPPQAALLDPGVSRIVVLDDIRLPATGWWGK